MTTRHFTTAVIILELFVILGCSGSQPQPTQVASTPVVRNQVIANKFQIIEKLSGDALSVSLDTDLPDETSVMVSISRSYFEKGNSDEYSINYFGEKSTVGRWREPRRITISHQRFSALLQDRLRTTAVAGIGGSLARIADDVTVGFTVPIFQTDPRFGQRNENLTGAVVTTGPPRIIVAEERVAFPIGGKGAVPQWVSRDALVSGQTYRISRRTPLMPTLEPVDPLEAIAAIEYVPEGSSITIQEVAKKDDIRWYRAETTSETGGARSGWINSEALIGQEIQAVSGRR